LTIIIANMLKIRRHFRRLELELSMDFNDINDFKAFGLFPTETYVPPPSTFFNRINTCYLIDIANYVHIDM